jgi:hypothetical protein
VLASPPRPAQAAAPSASVSATNEALLARIELTLQRGSAGYKCSFVTGARPPARVLALASLLLLAGCQLPNALRRSQQLLRDGFDAEERGGWVVLTAPASLLAAGGNALVGSFVPLGPPPEPDAKWFRSYAGPMLPRDQVAVVCHRERAIRIDRIRRPGGEWVAARHEPWHFPLCLEVLPGRYELEVQYFRRDTDKGSERLVTLQAESTEPSIVEWRAEAGAIYEVFAALGPRSPASGPAPRRHIPSSRSLGTSWWELETSPWNARIAQLASWGAAAPTVAAARGAWEDYERARGN